MLTPEPPSSDEPTVAYPREGQLADPERASLEQTVHSGANWFFWIAGLSVVNSFLTASGSEFGFSVGLAITSFADGFAHAAKASGATAFAVVFAVVTAGIVAVLGVLASRRMAWAFVVGMIGLAIDTLLLFIALPETILTIAIHLWALWSMTNGFRAAVRLNKTPVAPALVYVPPVEPASPIATPAPAAASADTVMEAPAPRSDAS